MENISNSISYLKGLMEGLDIDTSSKEGKIFEAIMDVLDEIIIVVIFVVTTINKFFFCTIKINSV